MDEDKINKMAQNIEDTFCEGGSHAHNIITCSLQIIAEHDKARADSIYQDLVERGF